MPRRKINVGNDIAAPRRGTPRADTLQISLRLCFRELDQIDAWIASAGPPYVSRQEAIRRLMERALADQG